MKRSFLAGLVLVLSGCASSVSSPVNSRNSSDLSIGYSMAQAYFDVELFATQYALELKVSGPKIAPSHQQRRVLDYRKSDFVQSQLKVDLNPFTEIPQTITFSSESRVEEISSAFGRAIGALAAVSGSAPSDYNIQSGISSSVVDSEKPAVIAVFADRWYLGGSYDRAGDSCVYEYYGRKLTKNDKTYDQCFWSAVNLAAVYWLDNYVPGYFSSRTETSVPVVISMPALRDFNTMNAPDYSGCDRTICYSRFRPVSFTINVSGMGELAPSGDYVRPQKVTRLQTISAYVPDPSMPGYLNLSAGGLNDKTYQIELVDGAPTYVAVLEDSAVESLLNAPVNAISSALKAFVSIIPLRLYVDIQRREADAVIRGERDEDGNVIEPSSPDTALLDKVMSAATDEKISFEQLSTFLKAFDTRETLASADTSIVIYSRAAPKPKQGPITGDKAPNQDSAAGGTDDTPRRSGAVEPPQTRN